MNKEQREKRFEMVEIPTDRQIFEGEIETYWIDDNGILGSLSKSTV